MSKFSTFLSTKVDTIKTNCILTLITYGNLNYGIISIYRSPNGSIVDANADWGTQPISTHTHTNTRVHQSLFFIYFCLIIFKLYLW